MFIWQNNSNRFSLMGHKLVNMHRIREFGMLSPKWNGYSTPSRLRLCVEGEQKDWRSPRWQIAQGNGVFLAQQGRCTYAYSDPVSTHKTCRSSRHTKSSQEEWEVGRAQGSIDILSLLVEGHPFSSIEQRNSHTPGQFLGPGAVSQHKVKFIEFFFKREKLGGYKRGETLGRTR